MPQNYNVPPKNHRWGSPNAYYCFSYRADIPDKGRDFPMEVYVACSSNGEIGGFGTSVSNAEYRSPTIVKEFGEFTRRDEDFEW